MSYEQIESRFIATKDKGEVSSLFIRPDDAKWVLVLGHGASTNMRHATLQTIAERLGDVGIATFRYQFPYMERGGGGRESQAVALETVRSAVRAAHAAASDLPILVGGHSYSGRMSSLAAAESQLEDVTRIGVLCVSAASCGKAGTERAEHLKNVSVPMLFLSGTRDKLADLALLSPVCEGLATRQRCTFWILRTMVSRCSNALANRRKMSSSRWLGL